MGLHESSDAGGGDVLEEDDEQQPQLRRGQRQDKGLDAAKASRGQSHRLVGKPFKEDHDLGGR